MNLKVQFSKPESGWINISLKSNQSNLSFEASDVPNNCINDLIEALILIEDGINSKVEFHLEPIWYSIKFQKEDNIYILIINTDSVIRISGKFKEIVVPFYRALKGLISLSWKENDWPEINAEGIRKLEKAIKKKS